MADTKVKRLRHGSRARHARSLGGDICNFVLLAVVGFFMIIRWCIRSATPSSRWDELFIFPPHILVKNPTLDNFGDLSLLMSESWVPFIRYIFNTVFITAVAILGHVIVASMAAYVLEKTAFPGRRAFFKLGGDHPDVHHRRHPNPQLHHHDQAGLGGQLSVHHRPRLRRSHRAVSDEAVHGRLPGDSLLEAAKIDGSSEWRTFWTIVMPNVKPAWLTLIIFSIQTLWGTTGGVYIFSEEKKTLSYAMSQIVAGGVARAGAGAAVGVIMMIVPIAVFIISQRNIIQTMASSGMKD